MALPKRSGTQSTGGYFERKINFPPAIVFVQKNPHTLAFSTDFRTKRHIFAFALVTCFQVALPVPRILSHPHWNSLKAPHTLSPARGLPLSPCSPASLSYYVFLGYKEDRKEDFLWVSLHWSGTGRKILHCQRHCSSLSIGHVQSTAIPPGHS